jgi:hypothetical protein
VTAELDTDIVPTKEAEDSRDCSSGHAWSVWAERAGAIFGVATVDAEIVRHR